MTTRRQFLTGLGGALCASFLASCAGLTREDAPGRGAGDPATAARKELAGIVEDINHSRDILNHFLEGRSIRNHVAIPLYVLDRQDKPEEISDSMVVINAQSPGRDALERLGDDVDKINMVFLRMVLERAYSDGSADEFKPHEIQSVSKVDMEKGLYLHQRYDAMMEKAEKAEIIREPQPPAAPEPVSNYDHRLQI